MTIEIQTNGKTVKLWHIDYEFGPYPMDSKVMEVKQTGLNIQILECKIQAAAIIYESHYRMYAVVRSALRPEDINQADYEEFKRLVKYNQQRRRMSEHVNI